MTKKAMFIFNKKYSLNLNKYSNWFSAERNSARLLILSFLAFFFMCIYEVARPSVDSVFLAKYPSSALPVAWVFQAFFAALFMLLYNRFNMRFSLLFLLNICSFLSGAFLFFLLFLHFLKFEHSAFCVYIWKDVYIVILIEIFWSLANQIFDTGAAKKIYGLLLVSGSVGSIFGGFASGLMIKRMGGVGAMYIVAFSLMFCCLIGSIFSRFMLIKKRGYVPESKDNNASSFSVIWKSQYLFLMLITVCLSQIIIAIIDYKFNNIIQGIYVDPDLRADAIGRIHAAIGLFAIALKLLSWPLLYFFGAGRVFTLIPLFLVFFVFIFLTNPSASVMVVIKMLMKSFDYSIFRATKEILYIPLSFVEKIKGKAFIDIFVYRCSKALSSLLLFFFVLLSATSFAMYFVLFLEIILLHVSRLIAKRYKKVLSPKNPSKK